MTSDANKPKSLQELLNAPKKQLTGWSKDVDLQEPEHLEAQDRMLEALLEATSEQEEPSPEPKAWWLSYTNLFRPMIMAFAMLSVVIWFGQQQDWFRNESVPEPGTQKPGRTIIPSKEPQRTPPDRSGSMTESPHILGYKGSRHNTPDKRSSRIITKKPMVLHLGAWKKGATMARRLGNGDICSSDENISFGFTLHKAPGYLYLWSQDKKGKSELLYPASLKAAVQWKQGFRNLEYNQKAMFYPLKQLRGQLTFVVLKSSRPLGAVQYKKILRAKKIEKYIAGISQKQQGLSFDAVAISVKER